MGKGKKNSINWYILSAFVLILIISLIGFKYYDSVYKSDLKEFEFKPYEDYVTNTVNVSKVKCTSDHDLFVEGDKIICSFKLSGKLNQSTISIITNDGEYTDQFKNLKFYNFSIDLDSIGLNQYKINLEIKNRGGFIQRGYYHTWYFNVKSLQEYNQITNAKVLFLMGLITLATVTVTSTLKNIKDLLKK